MNKYLKNLNRLEFIVTDACTGRCKHCSEGEHIGCNTHIEVETAVKIVHDVAVNYNIKSLMTFGGEPLIFPETVYAIHCEARKMNIPKRQIITNGFFSRDNAKIREVANRLVESGVNEILLSVDAFHQETIPLKPVKEFAAQLKVLGIKLRTNPAWLISKEHDNTYNQRTIKILDEFEKMGIEQSNGNAIFFEGNALKYLVEYYNLSKGNESPYEENPADIHSICVAANGDVLNGNVYEKDIMSIIEGYAI